MTADIVVKKNGTHQVPDIPGTPLELPLEVGNYKPSLLQVIEEAVQTDMIRFLCIFHGLTFMCPFRGYHKEDSKRPETINIFLVAC